MLHIYDAENIHVRNVFSICGIFHCCQLHTTFFLWLSVFCCWCNNYTFLLEWEASMSTPSGFSVKCNLTWSSSYRLICGTVDTDALTYQKRERGQRGLFHPATHRGEPKPFLFIKVQVESDQQTETDERKKQRSRTCRTLKHGTCPPLTRWALGST